MDLDVKITHGHITGQRPGMVLMKPQDQRCFRSTNLRLFHSRRHVLDAPLSNKVTNDRFMLACSPQLAAAASIDPNCAIIHESIYSKFPIKFSLESSISMPDSYHPSEVKTIKRWKICAFAAHLAHGLRASVALHCVFRKLEHIFL